MPRRRPGSEGASHYDGRSMVSIQPTVGDVAHAKPPTATRVLILSADIGEGHDLPARMLAQDIEEHDPDAEVVIADGLAAMGTLLTRALRDGSEYMFRWLNPLFDLQYYLIAYVPPTRWLSQVGITVIGGRGLRRLVRAFDPDIVVSTYPGTNEVLGRMRSMHRMPVPLASAITDLSGLRYCWSNPGVDLHLITHKESEAEVRSIAPNSHIEWVKGLTAPHFLEPVDRMEARRALDLPEDRPVAVVSGGGWGVGDVASAVDVVLERDGIEIVCLCGHNDWLRETTAARYADEPRVRVEGFTNQMSNLLAAADVLVHSTGGLTMLEAQIRGCPAISYGWGVAHIRANNRAYVEHGIAQVARNQRQLRRALDVALARRPEPDDSFRSLPSAGAVVLRYAHGHANARAAAGSRRRFAKRTAPAPVE